MKIELERPWTVRFEALPPLALYVHIPWCVRKCPYCDFNSHERGGDLPEKDYIEALAADLEELLPSVWGTLPTSPPPVMCAIPFTGTVFIRSRTERT